MTLGRKKNKLKDCFLFKQVPFMVCIPLCEFKSDQLPNPPLQNWERDNQLVYSRSPSLRIPANFLVSSNHTLL